MTYADYPDTAKNNARKALNHKKDNGSSCGTRVGWLRANQIANGEGLSEDTVQRTYSFLSRAETYDQGKYFDEDGKEICGSIMFDAWGGSAMKDWAEAKFKKIADEALSILRNGLKENGFGDSAFMKNVTMLSIFERPVIEVLAKKF
jgi:hypothetical protein